MARIGNNIFTQSMIGMFGKQIVIKRRNGKPYMSSAPYRDPRRKKSIKEKETHSNFKESSRKASELIKVAELKKAYQAAATGGQSAFNVAVKDGMNPPEIKEVTLQAFQDTTKIIFIHAVDDFRVKEVEVEIHDTQNKLIEKGYATPKSDTAWIYLTTKPAEVVNGSKIVVKASDLQEMKHLRRYMFIRSGMSPTTKDR